jgi:Secretion system C-terminal sorting domain
MKHYLFLLFYVPLIAYAQLPSVYVSESPDNYRYQKVAYVHENFVLITHRNYASTEHSFHKIDLHRPEIRETVPIHFDGFENIKYITTLPDLKAGTAMNFVFSAVRNDSFFLINCLLSADMEVFTIKDVASIAPPQFSFNGTCAVQKPGTTDLFFVLNSGSPSVESLYLVKVSESGKMSVKRHQNDLIRALGYCIDLEFIGSHILLTGRSPAALLIDEDMNLTHLAGITLFSLPLQTFYSKNFTSIAKVKGKTLAVGFGAGGPLIQGGSRHFISTAEVVVESDTLRFQNFKNYDLISNKNAGLITAVDQDAEEAIYVGGIEEPAAGLWSLAPSYFFLKKIKDDKEIFYRRYGGDHNYTVFGGAVLKNGYFLLTGSIFDYYKNGYYQGFYAIMDAEGNLVSASHDIKPQAISVFPNPVKNELRVSSLPEWNEATVQVCDLQGRVVVQEHRPDSDTIDVGSLPSGVYILHARHGKGVYYSKFVKE